MTEYRYAVDLGDTDQAERLVDTLINTYGHTAESEGRTVRFDLPTLQALHQLSNDQDGYVEGHPAPFTLMWIGGKSYPVVDTAAAAARDTDPLPPVPPAVVDGYDERKRDWLIEQVAGRTAELVRRGSLWPDVASAVAELEKANGEWEFDGPTSFTGKGGQDGSTRWARHRGLSLDEAGMAAAAARAEDLLADGGESAALDAAEDTTSGDRDDLTRVTVNMSARTTADLAAALVLSAGTGDTKTDVINRAVQTYRYLLDLFAAGSTLYVVDADADNTVTAERLRFL